MYFTKDTRVVTLCDILIYRRHVCNITSKCVRKKYHFYKQRVCLPYFLAVLDVPPNMHLKPNRSK